jgi:AraC-like DNA-binding protein
MKEVRYEFEELESHASFEQLCKAFQGILKHDTIHFDNPFVQGQLIKKTPEDGLWIRKWKLTVLQKVTLHRHAASEEAERKFSLIYFLNPSIFDLKDGVKKLPLNTQRNNMFLSNEVMMDFSVAPKQPFYVVDITFTRNWICEQFHADDPCLNKLLDLYMKGPKLVLMEPCHTEEYKLLHELDTFMQAGKEDVLFVRSRIYQLICSFFSKAFEKNEPVRQKQSTHYYEQLVQAEAILMQQLQKPPKVEAIAKSVNMSTSSLLRQFKAMYGKSLHEYYIGKKMELARKMMIENQITIKKLAESLGYKQASHFIETFTKHFGYSPGSLKAY